MSRRIIPILCALAVAVVPATALAQPAQDPSPTVTRGGVVYGDTKYDVQNQHDLKSPVGGKTAYELAISGDTKGDLPRAIAPAPANPPTQVTDVDRIGSLSAEQLAAAYGTTKPATPASAPTASHDTTDGWQIAALVQAALLAACALGAVVLISGRTRSRRLGT
jgi:hexokinase